MPRCFMAKKLKYPYQRWKETQADLEVTSGDLDLQATGEAGHDKDVGAHVNRPTPQPTYEESLTNINI